MTNSADPDLLASQKPNDLDLHCLQRRGLSGFSRTRVNKPSESALKFSDSTIRKPTKEEICLGPKERWVGGEHL